MTESVKTLTDRIVRAFEDAPTFLAAKESIGSILEEVDFTFRKERIDLWLRLETELQRNRRTE